MEFIILAVVSLGSIGAVSSIILFVASKRFETYEDPKIAEVQDALPAANCGGCGYPGCAGFAEACVKSDTLDNLFCPAGGNETMSKVARILGKTVESTTVRIAVVRCNGTCENRPSVNRYDGIRTCSAASSLYGGETACSYGCLGMGDCVSACTFGAIRINPATKLAEVDDDKCTSCGACVAACPKSLIELRKKGLKSRRIYVGCRNKDKGATARKACAAACIACNKCVKVCPHDAITIVHNLAFISDDACRLCRKCVTECPTSAILELNFPPQKDKAPLQANEKTE